MFVVVAQSANADGANVSWIFYFTEFNGQIYSLDNQHPHRHSWPALAADAEQFVGTLNARNTDALTASTKR